MKTRILSSIIMLTLLGLALFFLPPFYFTLTLSLIVSIGVFEWCQFCGIKNKQTRIVISSICFILLSLFSFYSKDLIDNGLFLTYYSKPILYTGLVYWFLSIILTLTYPKSVNFWNKSPTLKSIFGFLSLIPFIIATLSLRFYQYQVNEYVGVYLLLYVLSLIWLTDSFAYFTGKAFGKHKLSPNISPNKTIEGVLGGIFFAMLFCVVFVLNFKESIFDKNINDWHLIGLSFATIIFSIFGDLVESMYKREAGIKDSGNLIAGHGGVLDRIDSLMAGVVVFLCGFLLI